jgi:RND family efflux transporter MFP subunit
MGTPDIARLKIDREPIGPAARASRLRRRHLVMTAIIAAVIAGTGVAAVITHLLSNPTVQTATVTMAYPSQNYTQLNATGHVVAQRKAALSTKASGRLEWLGVLEGMRVRKGELVAQIENRDVRASLDQAIANVGVAEANLEQGLAELLDARNSYLRSQELLRQNFISPASHDQAQARYNKVMASISGLRAAVAAARANQQAAKVALDQTLIRAPFDGVILTKNANVGDNIMPYSSAQDTKGAVITVADMDTLEVEADVAESNVAKIKVGHPTEIQLDAFPDERLPGRVSRMVPTVDRTKATVMVKIRFDERDPRVLPDMSAKVAFLSKPVPPEDQKAVAAAQPGVITTRNGSKVAFAINDNILQQKQVSTGRGIGELVEISSPQTMNAGDLLVLHPNEKLESGMTVRPAKK